MVLENIMEILDCFVFNVVFVRTSLKKPLILLLVLFVTTGCNFPLYDVKNGAIVSDQVDTLTPQKNVTLPVPSNLETSGATLSYQDCYWNWATKSLAEETTILQTAIDKEGLSKVTGTTEAYGENCIDPATNSVARFAVMETDFRFTVEVTDLSDTQALGELIFRIIGVLQNFPEETFPGAHPGYVGMRFQEADDNQNLWFLLENAESAISDGKRGSELYFILSNRN